MSKTIEHRLNRLSGQLEKIKEEIASGADCADVIPQFLAVKGSVASAFEAYVSESLDACPKRDEERMKRLIALLVRS
jgi:DNA-binding FrmR family transcriptional regulator